MSGQGRVEPSRMLISIMNVAANPKPSCLLLMDLTTKATEWVDVGLDCMLASGLGIYDDDRYVYHVCIVNEDRFPTHLIVLDRHSCDVVHTQFLPEVVDAHSLVRFGDRLCIASTGTDEIVSYGLEGPRAVDPQVVWTPTGAASDMHHVNSLFVHEDELYCSAFGPRESELYSWATAAEGYVRNVTRGETLIRGLRQPHSVVWETGRLYFCNSPLGTINRDDGVLAYLHGYSRGLAFGPGATLYAGTSLGRRPARDENRVDVFDNLHDTGGIHGRCAVVELAPDGLRTEIGLGHRGDEIYDLRIL